MAKIKRKKRRASAPVIAKAAEESVSAAQPAGIAAAGTSADEAVAEPDAAGSPKGRTVGQFQDIEAVIQPDMIAYLFWKEWWKARDRGDFDFIYQLSAEGSLLREHFGDRDAFSEVCRRKMRPILGSRRGDLRLVRLHSENEAYIIHVVDLKARERRDYDAERWFMLRGDGGWRVNQIDKITVSKTRSPEDLSLADFPDVVFPAGITPANG